MQEGLLSSVKVTSVLGGVKREAPGWGWDMDEASPGVSRTRRS